MRRVQSDSACEHNDNGYHLWWVYAHDKMWRQLDCLCARCGAASRMTHDSYVAIDAARRKAWDEKYRPRSSPPRRTQS